MTEEERPDSRRGTTWKTIAAGAGFLTAFIIAPLFGVLFVFAGIAGFIADAYRSHEDDGFRATATATTATIDAIDVRHFTENLGPGRTECVPQATGTANGEPHTWDLVDYAACGDVYEVGQQLQIMYDRSDVDHAVLADQDAAGARLNDAGVHVQVLVIGIVLAAVGTGSWIWLVRSDRRKRQQS